MSRAVTKSKDRQLWTAVSGTASAPEPTGASGQGDATSTTAKSVNLPGGRYDRGTIVIQGTGGTTTSTSMTVTAKVWGYIESIDAWSPLGTSSTAADRGKLNEANAISEDGTNKIRYAELIEGLATFNKLYLECDAVAGASLSFDAWLVLRSR